MAELKPFVDANIVRLFALSNNVDKRPGSVNSVQLCVCSIRSGTDRLVCNVSGCDLAEVRLGGGGTAVSWEPACIGVAHVFRDRVLPRNIR